MHTTKLQGMLLIAMPHLNDPYFRMSTVLLCHHDKEGAMGLIINHPQNLSLNDVLEDLRLARMTRNAPVYFGGPVEPFRGFVLHDATRRYESTLRITENIFLTVSRDILVDLGKGIGPEKFLFFLGYAGWGAGQLESEIERNDWLISATDPSFVFDLPWEKRWTTAIERLGVDVASISEQVGHA